MQNKLICLVVALFMFACGSDDDTSNEAGNAGSGGGEAGAAGSGGGEAGAAGNDDECGTIHTVTTTDDSSDFEVYMDFAPEDLTIAVGDCVNFEMSNTHNAVEMSQEAYENRMNTPLEGGFSVTYGETKQIKFDEVGVHYYMCQPHVRGDMVGTITVQ